MPFRAKGQQPALPVQINWSHPLSRGLIACAAFGQDLVSKRRMTIGLGGQTGSIDRAGPYGRAAHTPSGTSGTVSVQLPQVASRIVGGNKHSIFSLTQVDAAGIYVTALSGDGERFNYILGLSINQFSANEFQINYGTGAGWSSVDTSSIIAVRDKPYALAATFDGTNTIRSFFDGELEELVTGDASNARTPAAVTTPHLIFFDRAAAGFNRGQGAKGRHFITAIWERSLSDAEQKKLAQDPYCFLTSGLPVAATAPESVTITGSGASVFGPAQIASTGEREVGGSGALQIGGVSSQGSGDSSTPNDGTGALSLGGAQSSGSGKRQIDGSGSLNAGGSVVSSDGVREISGSGFSAVGGVALSGDGEREVDGSGDAIIPPAASGGSGSSQANNEGTGSLLFGGASAQATGERQIEGTGSLASGGASTSATGEREATGAGALASGAAQVSANAQTGANGSGVLSIGPASVAASGVRQVTGAASLLIGSGSVQGAGTKQSNGAAALLIGAVQLQSTGRRSVIGAASLGPGAATILGGGGVNGAINGSGTLIPGSVTVSGAGTRSGDATGALYLGGVEANGIGERSLPGAGGLNIPSTLVNGIGAAGSIIAGSGGLVMGGAAADGTGEREVLSSGSLNIGGVQADASGVFTGNRTGTAAMSVGGVSAASVAIRSISGIGSVTFPAAELDAIQIAPTLRVIEIIGRINQNLITTNLVSDPEDVTMEAISLPKGEDLTFSMTLVDENGVAVTDPDNHTLTMKIDLTIDSDDAPSYSMAHQGSAVFTGEIPHEYFDGYPSGTEFYLSIWAETTLQCWQAYQAEITLTSTRRSS